MDPRLFATVFASVFVAELGDKTQLMAMAFATKYKASRVLLGVAIGALTVNLISVLVGRAVGATLAEHKGVIGIIAGAALDVGRHGDQMPPPRLAARRDVVATPHVGGLTQQAVDHQAFETTRQAAAILRGEAPAGSMNAEAATRLARMRG